MKVIKLANTCLAWPISFRVERDYVLYSFYDFSCTISLRIHRSINEKVIGDNYVTPEDSNDILGYHPDDDVFNCINIVLYRS